jgi:hypothetical protein
MAILLLPTLPLRLTFLGIFVFVAVTVIVPSYWAYAWLEIMSAFLAAGVFAARESLRRTGSGAGLQRGLGTGIGVIAIGVAIILMTRFVAAGGTIGAVSHHTLRYEYAEFDIVVVTLGVLLWIPQVFFSIQLDMNGTGHAQRTLLGLVAVTASILTGAYILLEHFGGGALRSVSIGPLITGVVGLVVLITPIYRSLARACWNRGISGILQFGDYRQGWGKTLTELRKAIDGAAERKIARTSVTASVEATVTRPQSEPRAKRAGLGWPTWGLFAACGFAVFGTFIAVAAGNSSSGTEIGGWLIILAPVIALACAVGALRRRIRRRRASQHPAGATQSDRVSQTQRAPVLTSMEEAMTTEDVQPQS